MMSGIFFRPRVCRRADRGTSSAIHLEAFRTSTFLLSCRRSAVAASHGRIRRSCLDTCGCSAGGIDLALVRSKSWCFRRRCSAASRSHGPPVQRLQHRWRHMHPPPSTRSTESAPPWKIEETEVPELTLDAYDRCKNMVAQCCNGCWWRTFCFQAYVIGVAWFSLCADVHLCSQQGQWWKHALSCVWRLIAMTKILHEGRREGAKRFCIAAISILSQDCRVQAMTTTMLARDWRRPGWV